MKEALAVIPVGVRTALQRAPLGSLCCRRAELATMVALRGRWHATPGQVALVMEMPTAAAAERLCRLLRGLAPDAQVLLAPAPGHPSPTPAASTPRTADTRPGTPATTTPTATPLSTSEWTVIARPATPLARQTGLLTRHGQPLLGLPASVLHGQRCCAAAAWRAALLTTAHPTTAHPTTVGLPTRLEPTPAESRSRLEVGCPNPVIAVALLGMARRLGVRAQIDTRNGRDYAQLPTDRGISQLLTAAAGPAAAAAFPPLTRHAPRRPPTSGGDAANTRKASRAAAATATQIAAAFTVLGPDNPAIPTQLRDAGRLRLAYPELSLAALAARAQPPLTKDTLHGRIRRLLALAARHHTADATDTRCAG